MASLKMLFDFYKVVITPSKITVSNNFSALLISLFVFGMETSAIGVK